ncbi:hypothetical protein CPLU01_03569 [Colletotrichum plurivorum]|uniref:Uncharacterized protein n=1 Tax=Colletotrichum plurivorum TaxID=2175906 RepID=A0A8H6KRU7_9PEZI|nr:hypothetical protein CPLU01_03569 [Colletotrichum plurivorum]
MPPAGLLLRQTSHSFGLLTSHSIVVVHGVSCTGDRPWVDTDDRPAWLKRDLFEGSNARIIGFNYEAVSDDGQLVYTQTGFETVARKLLDSVELWREDEDTRPLAFLGHDLGGVVVKMRLPMLWYIALSRSTLRSKLRSILLKFIKVFVGCPHRALSLASLTDDVATLIYNTRNAPRFGLLETARLYATTALQSNHLFLESNVPLRVQVASVFSQSLDRGRRVFDEFTATLDFSCETRIGLPGPHSTLLCGDVEDIESKRLQKILGISRQGDPRGVWPVPKTYEGFRLLLSNVTPPRVFHVKSHDATASGLLPMDEFADWTQRSQSPHAARYLSIPNDRTTPSVINDFVRFISENNKHTSRPRFRIFSFQFRRLKLHPDIDMGHVVDGTRLVLASFVAQALAYTMPRMAPEARPPSLSTLELASPEILTEYSLKRMFIQLNLSLWNIGIRAIWSVWDLDQCAGEGEPVRLVQALKECFQFTEFKPCILLSGSEPSMSGLAEIMESAGVPPLNLGPRYGTPIDVEARISQELELLQARYPSLGVLPGNIRNLLIDSDNESTLRETFLRWVVGTARRSVSRVQWLGRIYHAIGDQGHLEPQRLQSAILSSLSSEGAKTMERVLRWVLYSRRPFPPPELVAALALEDSIAVTPRHDTTPALNTGDGRDDGNGSLASFHAIADCLSGLIRVVDDEVHLSFVTGVDVLAKPGLDGVNMSHLDDAESNLLILRCLLRHLSSEVERHVSTSSRGESFRPSMFHHDFTAYAVHFWPHHYKLAHCHPSTREKTESCLASFLKQEPAAVSMMLRYFQIGSPETAPRAEGGEKPVTAVALLARCGFTDIGEIGALTSCPGWESDPETVFPALLEAVRGGHKQLVRGLPMSLLDDEAAESILSSTNDGQLDRDVMIHLFRQKRSRDGFQLPAAFRYHAAYVGIEEIVEKTQEYPADRDLWRNCMLRAAFAHDFEVFEIMAPHAVSSLKNDDKNLILEAASHIRGPADTRTLRNLLPTDVKLKSLYAPAISGNYLVVEDLLSELSKDVDIKDIKPSLDEATKMSSVEVVKVILKHVDPVGDSEILLGALHLAVQTSASAETCALFLDTGVDLENWNGNLFLAEAVIRDNMELAKLFVGHGVSIDAKNPEGEGALFIAASKGLLSMVEFLIDEHADVNGRTDRGLTPLYGASLNNKPESPLEAAYDFPAVLRLLVTKASLHLDSRRLVVFGDTEVTALFLVAKYGVVESARLLLEHGNPDLEFAPSADIDEDDSAAGYTALAIAALHSNTDIVRLLLEKGANVNHRVQRKNRTILHCASTEETVAILLEYGPDLEAKDYDGRTPLNWKSLAKDTCLIRRLANAGANLEAADSWGESPLVNAVEYGCLENFRFLFSKGSPINVKGGRYGSAVHPVTGGRNVNAEPSYCRSIMGQAFLTGTRDLVAYLLDKSGKIDATDRTGLPSLFKICFRNTDALEVFDMLLESYSAVVSKDTRDHMSRTILHCAALAGHLDLVEKLAELEPELLQQRDHDGWSALHWAARQPDLCSANNETFDQDPQSKASVIRFLVRKGCPGLGEKVSAGGRTWTVMEIAKYHDAPDDVIDAVADMMEEKCITEDVEEASPTTHDWVCDGCDSRICGKLHKCTGDDCHSYFGLCFKCVPYKDQIHDPAHVFIEVGESGW